MRETGRVWTTGFLLLGVLLGLLGSQVVAWQYYIDVEPQLIGLHFLALNVGYVVAAAIAQSILRKIGAQVLALWACGLAFASLISLAAAGPPADIAFRLVALGAVGLSAGALGTALLYASEGHFTRYPALAANRAGAVFGSGCLLSTLIIGSTYFSGSLQIQTVLLSAIPLAFLIYFLRHRTSDRSPSFQKANREGGPERRHEVRRLATALFSLLLFFQFGNEWAVAGWLPLFLIHRLGSNPVWAISVLALYFLLLMLGRLAAQRILRRVNHRRFLIGSVGTAMCGLLLLSYAVSLAEATLATVLIGLGFAAIYPLLAERMDDHFAYRPGFYNGAISIAITGAMSSPWLLGFVAASLGMRYVMLLPALGSIIVLTLSLLLMLESHLMGEKASEQLETVSGTKD